MVARGGSVRDKSALPILTPKAPRRGDERSEVDMVDRQAELRSSDEAATLPFNQSNHRHADFQSAALPECLSKGSQ